MISKGKQFEKKFKQDFLKTTNCSFLYRVPDQLSGYKGTSINICDFIIYDNPLLYLIETKTHNGNTFPFVNFTQYQKMLPYVGKQGVRVGVVLWMVDHDTVVYLPVSTITQMKKNEKKSFNIKDLQTTNYNIKIIPSYKKRVFMDSDYSILSTLKEGE